jgi:hypothetical protein
MILVYGELVRHWNHGIVSIFGYHRVGETLTDENEWTMRCHESLTYDGHTGDI